MTDKIPNIVVIGSLNMDVVIESERQPQLGETILGQGIHFFPGGKGANQAVAAAKLGAKTTIIGAVGNDSFGKELKASLHNSGVITNTVKTLEKEATGTASILLTGGDNCIVVVQGAS